MSKTSINSRVAVADTVQTRRGKCSWMIGAACILCLLLFFGVVLGNRASAADTNSEQHMSFYTYSGVSSSVCFVSEADGLSFSPAAEEWHRVVTLVEARLHVDLPDVLIL